MRLHTLFHAALLLICLAGTTAQALELPLVYSWDSSTSGNVYTGYGKPLQHWESDFWLSAGIDTTWADKVHGWFILSNRDKLFHSDIELREAGLQYQQHALQAIARLGRIRWGNDFSYFNRFLDSPDYQRGILMDTRVLDAEVNLMDSLLIMGAGSNEFNGAVVHAAVQQSIAGQTIRLLFMRQERDDVRNMPAYIPGAEVRLKAGALQAKGGMMWEYTLTRWEEDIVPGIIHQPDNWIGIGELNLRATPSFDITFTHQQKRDRDSQHHFSRLYDGCLSYNVNSLGFKAGITAQTMYQQQMWTPYLISNWYPLSHARIGLVVQYTDLQEGEAYWHVGAELSYNRGIRWIR